MKRLLVVCIFVASMSACGSPSTTPTPAPPPAPVADLAIACPASQSVNTTTTGAVLTYVAPTVTGGTPPTTSSCTVQSGTNVPIGTTNVTCSASDSIGRAAECRFSIVVTLKVFLKYTKFMAFGDSVTEGEVSTSSFSIFGPKVVDPVNNYPVLLNGALSARYTQQSISVVNRGKSGERADDGADRLRALLIAGPVPEVLLLFEGYNEMTQRNDDLVATIAPTLSVDIDEARARGVKIVMVATFPPARDGRLGTGILPYIGPVNAQVRSLAQEKGALLVDLNTAMAGQQATLIGDDGLHPTVAGYQRIADTFFAAIKTAFESGTAPSALAQFRR